MAVDDRLLDFLSERSREATKVQAIADLIARRVSVPTPVTKNGLTYVIQPGQALVPLLSLADQWQWNRKTVRKFIETLEEYGYVKSKTYSYGTILEFPKLLDRTSMDETQMGNESPLEGTSDQCPKYPTNTVEPYNQIPVSDLLPDLRYAAEPLVLDEKTKSLCRQAYDLFKDRLPLLNCPDYTSETEKDIYLAFIVGMKADMSIWESLLSNVASNPFMNGSMAQALRDPKAKESFSSLFSCKWQKILQGT